MGLVPDPAPVDQEELAQAVSSRSRTCPGCFERVRGGAGARTGGVRLGRALVLLRNGDMTVPEFSEAVGFVDQYYFSHRFRRTCAPHQAVGHAAP